MFTIVLAVGALVAGSVATVAGFGIGSILTPLMATQVGTKLAVAAVSVPHFLGTALRFYLLRKHIDRAVLRSFGAASAAGGLAGALLHAAFASRWLAVILGVLLLFTGLMGLTGLAQRMRLTGAAAWAAGGLSGILGGLVGNQGGIRSAALLGFDIRRQAFIATSTAVGLVVDLARMPVYAFSQGAELIGIAPELALLSAGVLLGTIVGGSVLRKIEEQTFRRIVSLLVLLLGVYMLTQN